MNLPDKSNRLPQRIPHVSRRDDLIALRDAVQGGVDTAHHHTKAFPSESAYGHCTWHDSSNASRYGSVDAALAFLAAVLSDDATAMIGTKKPRAVIQVGDDAFFATANDPARALVLAILNALIAEADKAYTAMERI